MDAFNQMLRRNYIAQVATLFAERYPAKFPAGADEAAAFVQARIPAALKYGIDSELHIGMFLNFVLLYGDDFASKPDFDWAVAILSETEGTGNERMDRLDSRMRALTAGRKE